MRPTSRRCPDRRRPNRPRSSARAPASGSAAADLVGDAQQTLEGLGDAARAKQNGDKSKARGIQQQAMKDLHRFYATYGPGGGG